MTIVTVMRRKEIRELLSSILFVCGETRTAKKKQKTQDFFSSNESWLNQIGFISAKTKRQKSKFDFKDIVFFFCFSFSLFEVFEKKGGGPMDNQVDDIVLRFGGLGLSSSSSKNVFFFLFHFFFFISLQLLICEFSRLGFFMIRGWKITGQKQNKTKSSFFFHIFFLFFIFE